MTSLDATAPRQKPSLSALVARHWPVILGFALVAFPTLASLGRQVWSTDLGAHAPLVLASGAWLLWQCKDDVAAGKSPPQLWAMLAGLALAIPLYVFGRAYDFISLEAAALYLLALVLMHRSVGWGGMLAAAFPLFYLGFLVPPPGWIINQITAPLQTFVSYVATNGLQALGYPIIREGVTLYIAQYQLLVEEACSGMNSIVGLTSITLFYIYIMHKASWRYALFLTALIIPIAVFVNILRVTTLILLTYYYGDGVAQGFLHVTAGIVLFAVALVVVFSLDTLIQRLFPKWAKA